MTSTTLCDLESVQDTLVLALGTAPVLVGKFGNTKLRYAHITVGLAAPARRR